MRFAKEAKTFDQVIVVTWQCRMQFSGSVISLVS